MNEFITAESLSGNRVRYTDSDGKSLFIAKVQELGETIIPEISDLPSELNFLA